MKRHRPPHHLLTKHLSVDKINCYITGVAHHKASLYPARLLGITKCLLYALEVLTIAYKTLIEYRRRAAILKDLVVLLILVRDHVMAAVWTDIHYNIINFSSACPFVNRKKYNDLKYGTIYFEKALSKFIAECVLYRTPRRPLIGQNCDVTVLLSTDWVKLLCQTSKDINTAAFSIFHHCFGIYR